MCGADDKQHATLRQYGVGDEATMHESHPGGSGSMRSRNSHPHLRIESSRSWCSLTGALGDLTAMANAIRAPVHARVCRDLLRTRAHTPPSATSKNMWRRKLPHLRAQVDRHSCEFMVKGAQQVAGILLRRHYDVGEASGTR